MTAITVTTVAVDGSGDKPLPTSQGKRGLRGAFLNLPFIGPVITAATAVYDGNPTLVHPTYATVAIGAGGVPVSTGYRDDDSYSPTGGEIEDAGLSAADGGDVNAQTRASGRPAYTANGVVGGSTPGAPILTTGRAQSTGVDRFGRTKGVANAGAGLGDLVYTTFSRQSTLSGDGGRALGSAGRSTQTDSDAVGSNVNVNVPRPTLGASANPAAGTVGVVDSGANGIAQIDLHADDITGGASGYAGAQVALYKLDSGDTDEDGTFIGLFTCDGGTDITTLYDGAAATTYRVYTRFRYPVQKYIAKRSGPGVVNQGAIASGVTAYGYGPWSAPATLAVT